jgi:glycosyltransferase involved in cell wall biosynthesis
LAHLTPAYFSPDSVIGGGERYVYNLTRAIAGVASDRFEQSVFTLGKEYGLFLHDGIPVRVLPNENPAGSFLDGMSADFWRELATFDILHVHQSLAGFGVYCTAVGRALRKTLVLTDLGGGESPLMGYGGGLRLADGVLSISQYARSLIEPMYDGAHVVIVGPVDTDAFTPGELVPDPNTAICVSRIMRHKGIDRIIRALPDGLSLRVVGVVYDEPYYNDLRSLAAGRDVTFIHDADDDRLLHLYRTSGLFLQGSTTRDVYGTAIRKPELMGLTTLEAMSCGLPVVVSDAASLPELAPDARFGRVFSTERELRDILEAFVSGAWPARGAGALARQHVIAEHGHEVVGGRLADFYACMHALASDEVGPSRAACES